MPDEEDLFLQREKEMSIHIHEQNRNDLIKFYKDLAQLGDKKISKELKVEDAASTALAEAEELLSVNIKELSTKVSDLQQEELDVVVARLSLAMFLLERTNKLHEIILGKNGLSLYSLFVSLRNRVCEVLVPTYYVSSPKQIIDEYLDTEPILTACSELCGLAVPDLTEIVKAYKLKLADEIEKK